MSDKPYDFIETEEEPSGTVTTDVFEEDMEVEYEPVNLKELYPEICNRNYSLTDSEVDEELISTEGLRAALEGQQSNNNNGNNDVYTGKCRGVIASIINKVTSFFGDNQ